MIYLEVILGGFAIFLFGIAVGIWYMRDEETEIPLVRKGKKKK